MRTPDFFVGVVVCVVVFVVADIFVVGLADSETLPPRCILALLFSPPRQARRSRIEERRRARHST